MRHVTNCTIHLTIPATEFPPDRILGDTRLVLCDTLGNPIFDAIPELEEGHHTSSTGKDIVFPLEFDHLPTAAEVEAIADKIAAISSAIRWSFEEDGE